jgi:hypothetical protein
VRVAPLLIVAAALTACGGNPPEAARELAQSDGPPLYYLGDDFEGLPLTEVEPRGFFVYGECDGEGSGDTFHCTKPQVQLQHYALARRHPAMFEATPTEAAACARGTAAGRPVAAFVTAGGLEVYAGSRVVVIFGDSAGRTLRAARSLRVLRGPRGGAPPASVSRALARCSLELRGALAGG